MITCEKSSDTDLLLDLRSLIKAEFTQQSQDTLSKTSYLWRKDGEPIGFIQIFPVAFDLVYETSDPYEIPKLNRESLRIVDKSIYHHISAVAFKRPTNFAIALRKFYPVYPYFVEFPLMLTVQPATLDGITFDERLGFIPSLYPFIWYKTVKSRDDLPLMQRQRLQPRPLLSTPPLCDC